MKDFTVIILAAGKGKRMRSNSAKVLTELMGRPLIYYVLKEVLALKKDITQIRVAVGYKAKKVKESIKELFNVKNNTISNGINLKFIEQKQALGTADAVKAASKSIKTKNILVLCGDAPLIKAKTLAKLIKTYRNKKLSSIVLSAAISGENSLGAIIRDKEGKLKAIREKVDLKDKNSHNISNEINSGIYCFRTRDLVGNLSKITVNRRKREYFLTDIVEIFYNLGLSIDSYRLDDFTQVFGINTQQDLYQAQKILRDWIIYNHIASGVKVVDPATTFIEEGAKIGKNTIIYPFTFIENSVIIGNNCAIGPFIRLRKKTKIDESVQVGNFLEINRSHIKKGARIKHFGYIGDAVVSEDVNIGAGTVIANYDGKSKNKTFIDKGAFIGSDSVLVAPINIGKEAVTGAGSVVTKNVKSKTIVVGVPAKELKKKGDAK